MFNFWGAHLGIYFHAWTHPADTTDPGEHTNPLTIGTGAFGSVDLFKDIIPWLNQSKQSNTFHWDLMDCLVWPQGSVNSDKIVTVCGTWIYTTMYDYGSVPIVVNWKHKEALIATTNMGGIDKYNDGDIVTGVEASSFYVTGGPANCYEDTSGKWIDLRTNQTVSIGDTPKRDPVGNRVTDNGMVDLYRLNGTRIGTIGSDLLRSGISGKPGRGAYLVVSRGTGMATKALIDCNLSSTNRF